MTLAAFFAVCEPGASSNSIAPGRGADRARARAAPCVQRRTATGRAPARVPAPARAASARRRRFRRCRRGRRWSRISTIARRAQGSWMPAALSSGPSRKAIGVTRTAVMLDVAAHGAAPQLALKRRTSSPAPPSAGSPWPSAPTVPAACRRPSPCRAGRPAWPARRALQGLGDLGVQPLRRPPWACPWAHRPPATTTSRSPARRTRSSSACSATARCACQWSPRAA